MRNGLGTHEHPEAVSRPRIAASPHPRLFWNLTLRTLLNSTITTTAVAIDQAITKYQRVRSGPWAIPAK